MVPKELLANLAFRRRILEIGSSSLEAAEQLWIMCSRDLLFFLNTFGWVYEPRIPAILPFITYDYQDDLFAEMEGRLGYEDMVVVKSRTMGLTWMLCTLFEWHWQFHELRSFLLASRNEDLVDKADDPDSLFWKVAFLIKHQPGWLQPTYVRSHLRFTNTDNASTIIGSSTTGNLARGGRRTAMGIDELPAFPREDGYNALAASQHVSASRFFPFTPHGTANAAYDIAHEPTIARRDIHWSIHPIYAQGLYKGAEGVLEVLDKEYRYPPDYPFVLDGKLRSPWYDNECRRTPLPQQIAQELDLDFGGSNYCFFSRELIDNHRRLYVRDPIQRGELDFDKTLAEPVGFVPNAGDSRLQLWLNLDPHGMPPQDRTYCIGADVSAGVGASNSCLVVADINTGEQVAEFATPYIQPHELGLYAAALGRWFSGWTASKEATCLIVAESNGGHNRLFHKTLLGVHYGNVFWKRDERTVAPKPSRVPGWGMTPANKRELLEDLSKGVSLGEFVIRSGECLSEMQEYIHGSDGRVEHSRSQSILDPTGAGQNHGDRGMAAALCWHGMKDVQREQPEKETKPPPGSFLSRRMARRQQQLVGAHW